MTFRWLLNVGRNDGIGNRLGMETFNFFPWDKYLFDCTVISWPMNHGRFVVECKQMRWNSTRKQQKNFHSHPANVCAQQPMSRFCSWSRVNKHKRAKKKVNLNFMTVEKIKAHAEEKSYYRCAHKPAWKLEFFHRKTEKTDRKENRIKTWNLLGGEWSSASQHAR